MRKIIVGASRPRKFKLGAALIMWWENTTASHVYTAFESLGGKKYVYHSIGAGTSFYSYDSFILQNVEVYKKEIEVSQSAYDKLFDHLFSKINIKYSYTHLLGLFFKISVQYLFKINIKNPFKDSDKSDVCIEALCRAIDAAEIKRLAEDPEDMGMFEAMLMLRKLEGVEINVKN